MYKNKIKDLLIKKFVSEDATPGITVTDAIKKKNKEVNKDGVKAIEKDTKEFSKAPKEDKDTNKMATNKYNYTDQAEKTYHDEMETLNGLEMNRYDREPGAEFKSRAQKAMEGDSTMGNKGGKGMGNAEATWGASSDDFGKKLGDRVRNSEKKRNDAFIATYELGDKITNLPDDHKVKKNATAIGDKKATGDNTKEMTPAATKTKIKTKTVNENNENTKQIKESMKKLTFKKEFNGVTNALNLIPEGYKVDKKEFVMTDGNETYKIRWEGTLTEGKAVVEIATDKKMVSEDIQRMKALFNYKSEDTLGLVKGNARLDENKVFGDIWKKAHNLLEETDGKEHQAPKPKEGNWDEISMPQAKEAKKHIEGSVAKDKTSEAPKPKEGEWDEINMSQSKEAKKDIEGSVSKDKGTQAPKPKEGEWEEINKPQAKEAKKDIETGKGTKLAKEAKVVKEAAKAKEGNPDDAVSQAKEAKENIETGKGTKLAPKAKVVKEDEEVKGDEEEKDEEGGEEKDDNFYKADPEDTDSDEKEPSASEINKEVPPAITGSGEDDDVQVPVAPVKKENGPKLMQSKTTGDYFLIQNGKHMLVDNNNQPMPVPAEFIEMAKTNPQKALELIQDEAQTAQAEPELDENMGVLPSASDDKKNNPDEKVSSGQPNIKHGADIKNPQHTDKLR